MRYLKIIIVLVLKNFILTKACVFKMSLLASLSSLRDGCYTAFLFPVVTILILGKMIDYFVKGLQRKLLIKCF